VPGVKKKKKRPAEWARAIAHEKLFQTVVSQRKVVQAVAVAESVRMEAGHERDAALDVRARLAADEGPRVVELGLGGGALLHAFRLVLLPEFLFFAKKKAKKKKKKFKKAAGAEGRANLRETTLSDGGKFTPRSYPPTHFRARAQIRK